MLINKLGVEKDDDIAKLEDHRPVADPKNRETMSALLQLALKPVTRSELLVTPAETDATVSTLETQPSAIAESAHTDVA
jgi:hypothetical protein